MKTYRKIRKNQIKHKKKNVLNTKQSNKIKALNKNKQYLFHEFMS